jgi:hypothetical protein
MAMCVAQMKQWQGEIERFPGGFWCEPGEVMKEPSFGSTTVQALVTRGVAVYTERKENANGGFPIKAKLKASIS